MAQLFVLGNASLDVTLNVPRLPRAGETLMAHSILRAPGGKGLNQAVMAARAGAAVRFCAALGSEPEAEMIRGALEAERFAELQWVQSAHATDISTLLVAGDGENVIISTGDCADGLAPDVAEAFVAAMQPQDWLLIQGNLSETATHAACVGASRVIFNTAPIRWISRRLLAQARVVIANRIEAEMITGFADAAAAAALLGGGIGIVTMGAQGCIMAMDGDIRHFPASPATPVDTTGAGDIFCGVLAAQLVLGAEPAAAIDFAQRAAAIGVGRAGCFVAMPSHDELLALKGCLP